VVFGGWFSLIAGAFLVVGTLAHLNVVPVQGARPGWPFFVVPVIFLALGVVLFRHGLRNLTRPLPPTPPLTPVDREMRRTVLPVAIGFLVVGLLAMAGAFAAFLVFNAPGWVVPLVFFAPPVAYYFLVRGTLRSAAARWARAAPSPESRAADPTVAAPPELPDSPQPTDMDGDWPTVPAVETSPGRVLAHALPPDDPDRGCLFGCSLFMAVFWNAIVAVFAVPIVRPLLRGNAPNDWVQALFLIPFVLAGLALIVMAVWAGFRWVVGMLVGRVTVEVSGHPLAPGRRYELRLDQRGAVRLGGVAVVLVCEEQATYVAGTSKTTAKKVVARHPVEATGAAVPLTGSVEVPAGAMHSFESPNNEIAWTLRVTGRALGVLPYEQSFAVAVRPE
jgi:hypothetical protein